jgi:hypothetical protein
MTLEQGITVTSACDDSDVIVFKSQGILVREMSVVRVLKLMKIGRDTREYHLSIGARFERGEDLTFEEKSAKKENFLSTNVIVIPDDRVQYEKRDDVREICEEEAGKFYPVKSIMVKLVSGLLYFGCFSNRSENSERSRIARGIIGRWVGSEITDFDFLQFGRFLSEPIRWNLKGFKIKNLKDHFGLISNYRFKTVDNLIIALLLEKKRRRGPNFMDTHSPNLRMFIFFLWKLFNALKLKTREVQELFYVTILLKYYQWFVDDCDSCFLRRLQIRDCPNVLMDIKYPFGVMLPDTGGFLSIESKKPIIRIFPHGTMSRSGYVTMGSEVAIPVEMHNFNHSQVILDDVKIKIGNAESVRVFENFETNSEARSLIRLLYHFIEDARSRRLCGKVKYHKLEIYEKEEIMRFFKRNYSGRKMTLIENLTLYLQERIMNERIFSNARFQSVVFVNDLLMGLVGSPPPHFVASKYF